MTKLKFALFLFLGFCINNTIYAQLLSDPPLDNTTIKYLPENLEYNKFSALSYSYCDEDGDGYMELPIGEISEEVLATNGLGNGDSEAIYVSTSNGGIVKISNPNGAVFVELICGLANALTDVAVNEQGEIYGTRFSSVFSLDTETCVRTDIFNFNLGSVINSLSFDTAGNLYFGEGDSSNVYRDDFGGAEEYYVWHDFGSGSSGGDFVMLNEKLYISWVANNKYKLYEVTLDNDYNYVSHLDLGQLPNKTYGLASELGKLYGVTPDKLYEIELASFSFTDIIQNNGAYGEWYGAAGLHEAITVKITAHKSSNDATSAINSLADNWTNTQQGGQTIYFRIEQVETGIYTLVEVPIIVYNKPQLTPPSDLFLCAGLDDLGIFDLTEVESELLQNVTDEVQITYHTSLSNASDDYEPLNTQFQSSFQQQTLYIKAKNTENFCTAITDFRVVNNLAPVLAPITNIPEERSLDNCYINSKDYGYFKLSEIYDQMVLDGITDYDLQFFQSADDAMNGYNEIGNTYYTNFGLQEEIFVTITNDLGCTTISNFFIDGDCIRSTEDLSGINFPPYFTPNGDGYHDFWNIRGISQDVQKITLISIFNRKGKMIHEFNPFNSPGWDGNYRGIAMPSNDYWYRIRTVNGNEYSGHVTLKR